MVKVVGYLAITRKEKAIIIYCSVDSVACFKSERLASGPRL